MSDTRTDVAQLISVTQNATILKKDGGSYKGLEIAYTVAGQARKKAIHSSFLSKKKELVDKLLALEEGATFEITTEGEPFYGLLDVREVAAGTKSPDKLADVPRSSSSSSFSKKPAFVDNAIGMQVGNALTNAANLIAAGDSRSLEEVAVSVLVLGESLKRRLIAGEFDGSVAIEEKPIKTPIAKPAVVKRATPKPAVEDDEDDPFAEV